jgi:putative FmdB family regulatory protein
MPIYEYQCKACGRRVEVIQKLSDPPLRKCEECSGKLEKLISRAAFQLKGGGWYGDGYSSSSGTDGDAKTAKSDTKDAKDTKKDAKKETEKKASSSGDNAPPTS